MYEVRRSLKVMGTVPSGPECRDGFEGVFSMSVWCEWRVGSKTQSGLSSSFIVDG